MNKKSVVFPVLTFIFLATAIIFSLLFISKNSEVSKLSTQKSLLQAQVSASASRANELSAKLNQANSTINQLSSSGSFVEGAACQSQQLTLAQELNNPHNPGGAAGTVGELFSYENVSKASCTVEGYPGFIAFDSKGYVVPNGPIQTGALGLKPKTITVTPGAKVYFVVMWNHVQPAPNQTCINATLLESTVPGNLTPLVLAINSSEICSYNLSVSALDNLNDF